VLSRETKAKIGAATRGRRTKFSADERSTGCSITVSREVGAHVRLQVRRGEAVDDALRRLLGLKPRTRL